MSQLEGLLQAGGCGRIIAGQLLHHAELVEGEGLADPVPEAAEKLEGLLQAGGCGRIIAGQPLKAAEIGEGDGLAEPVPEAAV